MSEAKMLKDAPLLGPTDSVYSVLCVQKDGTIQKARSATLPYSMMSPETNYITDLNEATTPGVWLLDGSNTPKNSPPGNWVCGIVEVYARYNTCVFQRIISGINGRMATRVRFNSTWSDWHVLE